MNPLKWLQASLYLHRSLQDVKKIANIRVTRPRKAAPRKKKKDEKEKELPSEGKQKCLDMYKRAGVLATKFQRRSELPGCPALPPPPPFRAAHPFPSRFH